MITRAAKPKGHGVDACQFPPPKKKTPKVTPEQRKIFPLKDPNVQAINKCELITYAYELCKNYGVRMRDAIAMLNDYGKHDAMHPGPPPEVIKSDLPAEDRKRCTDAGFLRKLTDEQIPLVRRYVKIWDILQEKRGQRRLITSSEKTNKEQRAAAVDVPQLLDTISQMAKLHGARAATHSDLKTSFYQNELSDGVEYFYAVMLDDGVYVLTRLGMGFVKSPGIQQTVTVVASSPAANDKRGWEHTNGMSHIDDTLRLAYSAEHALEDLRRINENMDKVAKRCNITWNKDPEREPHTRSESGYCGWAYDISGAQPLVWLPERHKAKAVAACDTLIGELSAAELMEAFGKIYFAATICGVNWADYYHLLKWYRRRLCAAYGGRLDWNANIEIWDCVRPQIRRLREFFVANTPRVPPKSDSAEPAKFMLFTDASTTVGYGGVLVNNTTGEVQFHGARWERDVPTSSINDLEMLAAARMMRRWAVKVAGSHVHLVLDNTASVKTVEAQRARSYHLNTALQVLQNVTPAGTDVSVSWIGTKLMPADEPSRGEEVDMEKVHVATDLVQKMLDTPGGARHGTRIGDIVMSSHLLASTCG